MRNIIDTSSGKCTTTTTIRARTDNWTEDFSLALTAEALQVEIRRNRPSLKGVGHSRLNIRFKGYVFITLDI